MNKGVYLAKGEWLYFLGADDGFWNENVLQKVALSFNDIKVNVLFGSISYDIAKYQPFILNKNKTQKHPQLNFKLWIYNTAHHQGTFYRKSVLENKKYDTSFKFLSDYAMNIYLYKNKITYNIIPIVIASCSSSGASKTGNWSLYREEILLKIKASSFFWSPFFYVIAFVKFFIRQIQDARK